MANALEKYRANGQPAKLPTTDVQRFGWDDFTDWVGDAAGWAWEHSPGGITSEFVDELTTGSGSGLGADIAGYITDPFTNQDEVDAAYANAQKTLADQQAKARAGYAVANKQIADTRGEISDMIGADAMDNYKALLYQLNPSAYAADTSPIKGFEFDRDVSKYLDPNAEYVIDQSVEAAKQAMSGQGGMTGGAAARALQAEASAKASELYGDAFDRMMEATGQEYGKARDTVSAEQAAKQTAADLKKFQVEGSGNLAGSLVGNMQGLTEDQVQLLLAQMATDSSYAGAIAQLMMDQASQPTTAQQILGLGGDVANIYSAFSK
jgi:hypothetical protein